MNKQPTMGDFAELVKKHMCDDCVNYDPKIVKQMQQEMLRRHEEDCINSFINKGQEIADQNNERFSTGESTRIPRKEEVRAEMDSIIEEGEKDMKLTMEQAKTLKKALYDTCLEVDWKNGTDISELFYQVVDACTEPEYKCPRCGGSGDVICDLCQKYPIEISWACYQDDWNGGKV